MGPDVGVSCAGQTWKPDDFKQRKWASGGGTLDSSRPGRAQGGQARRGFRAWEQHDPVDFGTMVQRCGSIKSSRHGVIDIHDGSRVYAQ